MIRYQPACRVRRIRLLRAGAVLAGALVAITSVTAAAGAQTRSGTEQSRPHSGWVGTWAASPMSGKDQTGATCPAYAGGLENETVRNIVHPNADGDRVRVRLSNVFGTAALTIDHASIGVEETGAQLVPGTLRTLRFGGAQATTIPAGRERSSDPLPYRIRRGENLAISVYVRSMSGPATYHALATQDNYLSGSGDAAGSASAASFPNPLACWMFVDGVDVPTTAHLTGSVVAFGDSITDGYQSGTNANLRWPDQLATRLAAVHGPTLSVVNEGISGNQLLTTSVSNQGVAALDRVRRDIIDQPGVKAVIMMIGINDIRFTDVGQDDPPATAARIIAGYRQIIAEVHAAGIAIYASPLTPFLTEPIPTTGYQDAAGEQIREQVNAWIRHSGAFDGVIDFARAVASPYDGRFMNPPLDADHLHPNDAGYAVMADAVPLPMLLRLAR